LSRVLRRREWRRMRTLARPTGLPSTCVPWPCPSVGTPSNPSKASKEHSMNRPILPAVRRWSPPAPKLLALLATLTTMTLVTASAWASELDLQLPTLDGGQRQLLFIGLGVCVVGMLFGLTMYNQVKGLQAHKSMLDVSAIIYETCKTYLLQ